MSGSSTAQQNQPQRTMLVQAAEAGDFDAVGALIAAGVDVNSANEHGMTALMAAAANGHLAIVSFLLESGADFKAQRYDGFDALALAVFYGHRRIVRELLARGADPNANDRLGTSPEIWATVRGFHDIAQVLTDAQTTNSAEAVAHQIEQSTAPLEELINAQEPALKAPRRSSSVESSYVESTYVAKPRYYDKRKSRKLVRWLADITSDWQGLTFVTLIVMLVCGLGTIAVLNLLGLSKVPRAGEPVIITEASAPDDSHVNAQNDLQSGTEAQQIPTTRAESDGSTERSIAEKKSNDRGGPQVDKIEHPNRLTVVKPLAKSSEKVDELDRKEAMTRKQETEAGSRPAQETPPGSRPAQSFRSSSVSAKSIPSTNAAGAGQEDPSAAKAPPQTFQRPPSIQTQRPRRVAGKNDRLVPGTSGRNSKGKVIQWP